MSQPSHDPGTVAPRDELLQHVSWLRRLATHLVVDPFLAEELVQETCVVALEAQPRDASKLRRWLATIARNIARQHARGEGRRRAREEGSARAEATEATDHLVERVSIQRHLADEVLALHEPYRSIVLLRFFEELPQREIARRFDIPVATVNSRLQRALALLRSRLGASEAAPSRSWLAAIGTLVDPSRALAPAGEAVVPTGFVAQAASLAGSLVHAKLAIALVIGIAAGAIVWRWSDAAAGSALEIVAPHASERVDASAVTTSRVRETPPAPTRAPIDRAHVAPRLPERGPAELGPALLRVRVLDGSGAPLGGIQVRSIATGDALGTSGAGGWLEVETRLAAATLVVEDPRWVTVHAGVWTRASRFDPVVVIAPAIELVGLVRDETGHPVPGARVGFALPSDFHTRFGDVLDATRLCVFGTRTDDAGRFELARVPAIDGANLRVVLAGYEPAERYVPRQSAVAFEIVLDRPEVPLSGALRGRVVDGNGNPVEGAHVGSGLASVVSDPNGDFELDLRYAVTSGELLAVKQGFLPVRMTRPLDPVGGESGWPEFVVLKLTDASLSIRGRVVDTDGAPIGGARVWLADPTPSAPIGISLMWLEGLMSGATIPESVIESAAFRPEFDGDDESDVSTQAGAPNALFDWVRTDANGEFELDGLDARDYVLAVMRSDRLAIHRSDPIRAGSEDALVVVAAPSVFPRVEGVVRTPSGTPVEGVRVHAWVPVVDASGRVFGGTARFVLVEYGAEATTDAAGRFSLEGVPREGARLAIRGPSTLPRSIALDRSIRPNSLDVVVYQRCHLQVTVEDEPERFDAIALENADGQPVDVMMLSDVDVRAVSSTPLVGGRSGVVSATNEARVLVLFLGEDVVTRVPIELLPGGVNRVVL